MRWLFLLLIVLNVFYYVWHQQEAPLRAKEVPPLGLYRGGQQNIQLLSELSGRRDDSSGVHSQAMRGDETCLYVGGVEGVDAQHVLRQRLAVLGVDVDLLRIRNSEWEGEWLRVSPATRHLLGDSVLLSLSREFNELKHKIMPCEGIATLE